MLRGNDPVAYAKRVAARVGVTADTKISKLTTDQFNMLVVAIADEEGYFTGLSSIKSTPSQPAK
jgi:ribosomal protein S13